MTRLSLCALCKHLQGNRCTAYPNGVPDELLFGREVHLQPRSGDQGIVFEPADESSAAAAVELFGAPLNLPQRKAA